jgi:hypothetical protein
MTRPPQLATMMHPHIPFLQLHKGSESGCPQLTDREQIAHHDMCADGCWRDDAGGGAPGGDTH